jgi:hypothetical protein
VSGWEKFQKLKKNKRNWVQGGEKIKFPKQKIKKRSGGKKN